MLNRRDFLKFAGITAGCAGLGCSSFPKIKAAQSKALPNVIFILADDMSYDSVSHLNSKIGNMKTPNIDRLARQGMYFTFRTQRVSGLHAHTLRPADRTLLLAHKA